MLFRNEAESLGRVTTPSYSEQTVKKGRRTMKVVLGKSEAMPISGPYLFITMWLRRSDQFLFALPRLHIAQYMQGLRDSQALEDRFLMTALAVGTVVVGAVRNDITPGPPFPCVYRLRISRTTIILVAFYVPPCPRRKPNRQHSHHDDDDEVSDGIVNNMLHHGLSLPFFRRCIRCSCGWIRRGKWPESTSLSSKVASH